jgi:hypothetical protein
MSSSVSRSSATGVPSGAKRWCKKKSPGDVETVLVHPCDGPQMANDVGNNSAGSVNTNQEDHAGAPTPNDFLGPVFPDRVPAKVVAGMASMGEADIIKTHGLHMLLQCANAGNGIMEAFEGSRIYRLLADLDTVGIDNRQEIIELLIDEYLPCVEMVPIRAGLRYLIDDHHGDDLDITPPEEEALIAVYSIGLYGFNQIQCYWLLDNLINKVDDLPSLTDDEGAMSCLFKMIKNSVVPTADFWSSGNGPIERNKKSTDFTVAHPGMIYKYNEYLQPGWSAPMPHDTSAQGKPSMWKDPH